MTNNYVLRPETSTHVCFCGGKHDVFEMESLGVTIQFCPNNNLVAVIDEPENICTLWDLGDHRSCQLTHVAEEHDHKLGSQLVCKVIGCGAHYTGGEWVGGATVE